ncbi:MAG: DoxX family protein [Candidatus Brennerbacteria bacterium]|nr:DoxX family protein [Candidatus Brennerbacteria bacterium]
MTKFEKISLATLRVGMGWMLFYAGITKVFNPSWSAEEYLRGAKTFSSFFAWLASPAILPYVNAANEWGLTLIGAFLIVGFGVRFVSILGSVFMLLYYLPVLDGWYPNAHSFVVDEHLIYVAVLFFLAAVRAGRVWGIDGWGVASRWSVRFPSLLVWFG